MADLFPAKNGKSKAAMREIASYSYTDKNGSQLYEVVRYEPKDFRQRRLVNGKHAWGLARCTLVLYRLPNLTKAVNDGRTIYVVEGEKDVHAIESAGGVGTCNSMGAGKWRPEYSESIRGAEVVIVADKDVSGYKHALHVRDSLLAVGCSVRTVESMEGKDAADHLAAGHGLADFEDCDVASRLNELAHDPSDCSSVPAGPIWISNVEPRSVKFLWWPYIPLGKVTIIEGAPGVGKSWVTCAIAAAVSSGEALPAVDRQDPARVLMLTTEDDLPDTVRPRLDALGANAANVACYAEPITLDEPGLERLEEWLRIVDPVLVTIDPLQSYMGATLDLHRSNETRPFMHGLKALAEKHNIAILVVRHTRKSMVGRATDAGLGSIDIAAAARSILLVGEDPEDKARGALVHIKSNVGPKGDGVGFCLEDGRFRWTGKTDLTADAILRGAEHSPISEAVEFLHEELAGGKRPSRDIQREAEGQGIAKRTLDRAKTRLGAKSVKEGKVWYLSLEDRQDCHIA
ncbi:MAG: AAA family ATPase [Fimbriimonadales bacterium]